MIIDLHTHIVPEHFPPAGSRASAERWPFMDHFESGRARTMIAGENFRTVTEQCWSPARRQRDMAAEGVDAQVISPMPELLAYWFTPEDGLEMSRYVNEDIARLVQAAPKQLYGLGMVPLQDPALAAKELSEIKRMGLLGVELGSNILGKSLGEARFLPFFEEVERQGLAVFVHALHPTFTDRYVGPGVDNPVGFPTDTGLTIASLINGLVLERYPNLRLAFSHGGGTFPYFLPRLDHAWSGQWNLEPPTGERRGAPNSMRDRLPKSPATYARMLYYDTLLFDGRAIRYLHDVMGASQLIVGTDYPFVPRELPVGKTLRTLGFSDDEMEAITSRNCLRFLGVDAPS